MDIDNMAIAYQIHEEVREMYNRLYDRLMNWLTYGEGMKTVLIAVVTLVIAGIFLRMILCGFSRMIAPYCFWGAGFIVAIWYFLMLTDLGETTGSQGGAGT